MDVLLRFLLFAVVLAIIGLLPLLIMPSIGPAMFGVLVLVLAGMQRSRERKQIGSRASDWRPSVSLLIVGSIMLAMGSAFAMVVELSR